MVGDYNGGVQFVNACNESQLFKSSEICIKMLSPGFDKPEEYQGDLREARAEYNVESKCFCIKYFVKTICKFQIII